METREVRMAMADRVELAGRLYLPDGAGPHPAVVMSHGFSGLMDMGLDPYALPALLFFLASYAVANLAAFGVVTQLRGRTNLADYRGLATAHPLLAAALILSFLSLVGIPPLAGFVGKLALFVTTIEAGYAWLAVIAVINTVVSLVYYLRVLGPVYFGDLDGPVPVLGGWAQKALYLATLLTIGLGILAEPLWSELGRVMLLP